MDKTITFRTNTNENLDHKFFNIYNGYYIVSKKWSFLKDEYITFVRKNNLAYCHNLIWAGPKEVHELDQFKDNEKTIVVNHSQIRSYIKKINLNGVESYVLPNTDEVRRTLGF